MSALAVTTPIRTSPSRAKGPDCSRPRDVAFRTVNGRRTACRIERAGSEPTWRLTRRGMAAAMWVVGLVMGSAAVTVVTAFLAVGNGPL